MSAHPVPVPHTARDLTAEVLGAALRRPLEVMAVERIGQPYGFAGETYRIDLLDGDERLAVVAKLWTVRSISDATEIEFYRRVAPATPVRLPSFHHGGVSVDARRAWIVLEALDGHRQGDELTAEPLNVVLDVAATMARIHAAWWDRVGIHTWLPPAMVLQRDADYVTSRREEYLRRFGAIPDPLTHALFEAIPEALPIAGEVLSDAPGTVVHQDLSLDNVLFLQPDDTPVVIDWARCGRGPAVLDLASLLHGVAPLEALGDVVERYSQVLRASRSVAIGDETLDRWLGGAMIHEFATRTLGVARWKANSPRGLQILDRWTARLVEVTGAWHELQPSIVQRILG